VPDHLTPEYHALERDKVFRKSWLCIARASEVPERGSYVVKDLPTFKTSVIVIRGTDDKIRTFYNACTHRDLHSFPHDALPISSSCAEK